MPTYVTTAKLSEESGVDVVTIRDLEERGILKAAPGREKFRKRWAKTAAFDLRRALKLYPTDSTDPHRRLFNAVLAPGVLAKAAAPQPRETSVTQLSKEEAMDRFRKRTAAATLSEKSAEAVVDAWLELRPGSKNDESALAKVTERVNKGKDRKQAAPSIRAYLVHTGLVERQPGGRRGVEPGYRHPPKQRRAPRAALPNGHAPSLASLDVDGIEALLPLLRTLADADLTKSQRGFLIAWLQKR